MDIRGFSNKELCELYSKHILSNFPNVLIVSNCQKELKKRGLTITNIYASVTFEFLDGVQEPVEVQLRDGVIKELWLKTKC